MYKKWIKDGVHKPGKTAAGLAEVLGVHRGTIYKMIAGTREIHIDELAPIAKYIEESIPMPFQTAIISGELITIAVEREVGVGTWLEVGVGSGADLGIVTIPRDHEFPQAVHHAYLMKGDSMVRAGILDGDVLVCIEPDGVPLASGKQVIVERNRAGVVEMSARIMSVFKDRVEYAVCASSDSYKPLVVKNKGKSIEAIRVVSILRRITRNIK